jgi:RIO-like serine/threonine protein kinase
MDRLLKELKGHSGSEIQLRENELRQYVRKVGNVKRNYERLDTLQGIIPVPKVYAYDGETMDMEYIHGLDMKTWLTNNTPFRLTAFLVGHLSYFARYNIEKDYTETYERWLSNVERPWDFSFTKLDLLDKLPKILPQSTYHGDMTLENIIYSNNKFYFIDPVTVPFDSYIFDIAKLRQDLDCKWFLRNDNIKLETKLIDMRETILSEFPEANNKYILILMLLRVYCHCEKNSLEYDFIMREVNRLWKS